MAKILQEKCIQCLACIFICPKSVFFMDGQNIETNKKKIRECADCRDLPCISFCPTGAIKKG